MLPFAPALPLETERLRLRAFRADDVDALHRLRGREDVARWLYQEPMTRAEAEELAAATGLPVELWDERLTTVTAERDLMAADLDAKARRRVVDKVAAAVMLGLLLVGAIAVWIMVRRGMI